MLRIHFTSTDLARTHVAEAPDPLWEIVFSLQMLQARYGRLPFAEWRLRVRTDVQRRGGTREVRQLLPLVPNASYFPDFLTPVEGRLGLEAGIEAVIGTSPVRIGHELGILHDRVGAPAWARELTDRSPHARARLGRMLAVYHAHALAPYWSVICRRAEADHARRTQTLRAAGTGGLLDSFRPAMRWRPPVLEIPGYPVEKDLHLQGRGLLLIPSHFCWKRPVSFADGDLPPTLLYPLSRDPHWMCFQEPDVHSNDPLARLLGRTRAAVLRAVSSVPNTSELARRTGITPAAASQHTCVLREAGLITSHRHANSVFHQPTELGAALLNPAQTRGVGP
ncbi:helix-turn-helix domain-containing protein [Nonomuraea sp. B19D2]|uniref:ArsR/SmtB family transcription factor n=1 Tax=Nonomuraea sp. B19D2 TaxID=3159561 RepID=UPI0032DADF30